MLESHPRVFLENEKPRCYVSQVGPASFNLSVTCNLKPMVGNSCLQSLSTIQSWWLYLHFEILIPSMYLLQQTDMLKLSPQSEFPDIHFSCVVQSIDDFIVAKEEILLDASRIVIRSGAALGASMQNCMYVLVICRIRMSNAALESQLEQLSCHLYVLCATSSVNHKRLIQGEVCHSFVLQKAYGDILPAVSAYVHFPPTYSKHFPLQFEC